MKKISKLRLKDNLGYLTQDKIARMEIWKVDRQTDRQTDDRTASKSWETGHRFSFFFFFLPISQNQLSAPWKPGCAITG